MRGKNILVRWKEYGAFSENKKGEWIPAIFEPYPLLIRLRCFCGRRFWTREGYEAHHSHKHILAL